MKHIINKHFITEALVFILILFVASDLRATTDSSPIICEDNTLFCNAVDLPISDLEYLLHQECGIRIIGLKAREDQRITYKVSGPILDTIKRLLRFLSAESYVFEFNGDNLARVLIYSRGKTQYIPPAYNSYHSQNTTANKVSAVKVLEIVPGSQAEVQGFQKDDIIVEYDAVPIKSASQLVSEVKKKKNDKQRVELVLVRNGSRQSYILNSGLIGVRIQTVRVSPDEIR